MQKIGAVASRVVDRWSWWRLALKDERQIGKSLPVYPGSYELGYYRTRAKGGDWEPCGIWVGEDGQDVGYRNGRQVDDLVNLFHWCCRNPISYEAYVKASEGGGFDDEPPAPRGIGDNSGATEPIDQIRIELSGEAEQMAEFLAKPVETQAAADTLGIWAKRLTDLRKRADGEREREKAPHLQACRDVDDRWRPLIAQADDLAKQAKRHVEPFLIAEKRRKDEEARKAREQAERLREMAKEATRDAKDERDLNERNELLRQAEEAEKAAEARNASAGRTGARVSVRSEKRARIVDYDACLQAFKETSEVRELIQSLANRAVKAGFPLAGVEVEIVEKVV